MISTFSPYILLIIIILFLVVLSQRLRVAYPVTLVLSGLALSAFPGFPSISIDPELILVIFLPPLLYEAAWYTSWKDFWKWRRVISSFAFIIVIFTALLIAVISELLIPGFSLALGLLLGAIVSPPDAVSASSILKHVRVPKRVSVIIEGESLLNDASSLVIFRFALIAVNTGTFVLHQAALDFFLVILMGIVVGLLVAVLFLKIHKWLPTDANTDIILTLTTPYVMYLAAESMHFSGVLAVVSGGLYLSSKSSLFLNHSSRLRGSSVWSALGFILNGLVFMLIGLELPTIIRELGPERVSSGMLYGSLITLALMLSRVLFSLGASAFTVFISRFITTADSRPGWKGPLIFGWSGMRGVVSLAAALSIPEQLNGQPFPQRPLILFITFTVILLTLVIQGLSLPLLISYLKMDDPDEQMPKNDQERLVRKALLQAGEAYLEACENTEQSHVHPLLAELRQTLTTASQYSAADHIKLGQIQKELISRQRQLLIELNRIDFIDEELIRKYQDLLDLEEEKLYLKLQ